MPHTLIYHITDVANLPGIIAAGGLISDSRLAGNTQTAIGYGHIKQRRMTQIRVPCCDNRYVGEFVPFYYCPRSPMLYTINMGNTGRPRGCQSSIVHLVSTFEFGTSLGAAWAVSDGNAGAFHSIFYTGPNALVVLNWTAIRATSWSGLVHQKHAEFLVADAFPWHGIIKIGCHDSATVQKVKQVMQGQAHQPHVSVEPGWYY